MPCRVSTAGRKYKVSRKVVASIRKSFARLYLRISKNQGQPKAYPRGTRQGRKKVSLRSGVQECHFALSVYLVTGTQWAPQTGKGMRARKARESTGLEGLMWR